jgi:hypothetical protein
MKTTVDLPDDLFVAAKKRAADERRTLRDVVASGIRAELQRGKPAHRRARPIAWVTVKGGLPLDADLSDRDAMYEALRRR